MVVAASTNDVIGVDGELPWHIPEDLKRFKALTMGKPIIMGRLTHESIGRPLPGRQNIVISRNPDYAAAGCTVVDSPATALNEARETDEVMVIGGGEIYRLFLNAAQRIYRTRVHMTISGDAFFPALDGSWETVSSEEWAATGEGSPPCRFEVLERTR